MAMAGADPFAIMKAMGHADIKTTMIYVPWEEPHTEAGGKAEWGINGGCRSMNKRRGRREKPYLRSVLENSHTF